MNNHIHLAAVPEEAAAVAEVMRRVHGRYAQYLNARRGRCGHLWQNRFNSCALGPTHLWAALRYVELNPVRAGLAQTAREYEWSSAEAHCSGQDPWRIADLGFWSVAGGVEAWRTLLAEPGDETQMKELRWAAYVGQPFGNEEFIDEMRGRREDAAASRARNVSPQLGLAFASAAY